MAREPVCRRRACCERLDRGPRRCCAGHAARPSASRATHLCAPAGACAAHVTTRGHHSTYATRKPGGRKLRAREPSDRKPRARVTLACLERMIGQGSPALQEASSVAAHGKDLVLCCALVTRCASQPSATRNAPNDTSLSFSNTSSSGRIGYEARNSNRNRANTESSAPLGGATRRGGERRARSVTRRWARSRSNTL